MASRNLRSCAVLAPCSNATCASCTSGALFAAQQRLKTKIVEAKKFLLRLEAAERDLLELSNSQHDPVTSKLPLEIVSEIFLMVLRDQERKSLHDRDAEHSWYPTVTIPAYELDKPVKSALHLATVSRSWRRFVYSIPQLWTSVLVTIAEQIDDRDIALLKQVLENSGTRPLQLKFSYRDVRDRKELKRARDKWPAIFHLAREHASRWFALGLCVPEDALAQLRATGPLPNLKRVSCKIPFGARFSQTTPLVIDWGHITQFHAASGTPQSVLRVPYTPLTHLRTASFSYQQIFDILRVAPQLTHLTIDDIVEDPGKRPFTPVSHAGLQFLEINRLVEVDGESVLALMRCPAVTELLLRDPTPKDAFWSEEDPLLASSVLPFDFLEGLRLKKLEWHVLNAAEWWGEALSILDKLPVLEVLDITTFTDRRHYLDPAYIMYDDEETMDIDILLEYFVDNVGGTIKSLFPHLKHLSFTGEFCISWDSFVGLFTVNPSLGTFPCPELQSLKLDPSISPRQPAMTKEHVLFAQKLLDGGFDLTIGEGPSPGTILRPPPVKKNRKSVPTRKRRFQTTIPGMYFAEHVVENSDSD